MGIALLLVNEAGLTTAHCWLSGGAPSWLPRHHAGDRNRLDRLGNESGKPHGHCYGSSASDEPPICVHLSAKDRATSESDSAHPDRTARITRCCSDVVAAGSPCDKESDGEPFAGEWSAHLARDLIATLLMGCWSCSDHVRVAGGVLAGHLGVASLYTRQGAAGAGMWDDRVLAE
jgi:hypothetical protein